MIEPLELESLLSAIGPESVLRGRSTLHKYQLQKAAELPRDIRRRMMRFLATDGFAASGDMPKFDYAEVLRLVTGEPGTDTLTPEQAHTLVAAVTDPELGMDLGIEANRIRAWGAQAIPKAEVVAGRMEDPDPTRMSDFRRAWEVATDPMVVMRDLAAGCLSSDQVATLSVLYPALYAEMRQAASDAKAATGGRKGKKWSPSGQKQAQLDVLLQQDTTDPSLAAAVQTVYAEEAQREQAPAPRPRSGGQSRAAEGLTPGEKAAAGA